MFVFKYFPGLESICLKSKYFQEAWEPCECIYVCVCVIVCNQQVSVEWGRNARASHCSALPRVDFPAVALAKASAGSGEPKR